MKIIQVPILKFFRENSQEAVVMHVDLGTYQGTLNELRGTKSASYHFYIKRNSDEVVQFVQTYNGAWHAGVVNNPTERASKFFGQVNPNRMSIGICYEGRGVDRNGNISSDWSRIVDGQKATDKQVELCADLIQHLGKESLPFFAHREITSYKPSCVLDFKERVVAELERRRALDIDMTKITTISLLKEARGRNDFWTSLLSVIS